MKIELTLKNFRCFPDSHPAKIIIEDGWTAFLGVNNAGKSALLRFFFEFRAFFAELGNAGQWANIGRQNILQIAFGSSVRDPIEVFHNQNSRPLTIELQVTPPSDYPHQTERLLTGAIFQFMQSDPIRFQAQELKLANGDVFPFNPSYGHPNPDIIAHGADRAIIHLLVSAGKRLANTFYIAAFRNVLNTGAKSDYFDIQVGDAFVRNWRSMQTGDNKRQVKACGEIVSIIERLFGFSRLEIRAANANDTLQIVIDGNPYLLHELGAGIAQFILVLVNAANARPDYILIDEPELHLHPSLQLDFLTSLGEFAKHGVLFSTHCIGLARSAADRIYSVIRNADGLSSRTELFDRTPNLAEFLGAMSYSSYQAIGFSKVLLVEGTTEVRTVQQFLRKLGKDHRILLLPLGGSSLIRSGVEHELAEIKRITADLHALIDSERAATGEPLSKDRQDFANLCRNLEINCHILDRRAIENYLPDAAVKAVKGASHRQLTPYEKFRDVVPAWGKQENWRIASETNWDEIKDTDLGKFLTTL